MADVQENKELASTLGSNASFFSCNVASYDSQASMFAKVWEKYGRIDALCANAGIVDRSSIYILDQRDSDKIPPAPDTLCTDVDWKGVLYGTQLAIHFMRKNEATGGSIVATASIASVHPHPTYPEYNGAKAAVLNFMRGTADVLKIKENIRFNCVMPGIVATKILYVNRRVEPHMRHSLLTLLTLRPPEMIAAVSPDCVTPISTVTSAYTKFLDDSSLYGQAIECSVEKHLFFNDPEMLNGAKTIRAVTVWDPLFKMMHHENSGLPDAIPLASTGLQCFVLQDN